MISFYLVKEPFTRYAMLEKGEADIVAGLTGPLLERIRANKDIKIVTSRYSGTSGILFNKELFPESADKRVRLAVGMAINRKEIAEKIQGGVCEAATGIFTPGTFGYLDGLPQIPYDPAKAKAQLGWEPAIRLAEGLAATVAYFRQRLTGLRDGPPPAPARGTGITAAEATPT